MALSSSLLQSVLTSQLRARITGEGAEEVRLLSLPHHAQLTHSLRDHRTDPHGRDFDPRPLSRAASVRDRLVPSWTTSSLHLQRRVGAAVLPVHAATRRVRTAGYV